MNFLYSILWLMNGYWLLIQSKFTCQSDWVIVMVIICHWFQLVTISQLLLEKLQRNNFQKNMIPAEPKDAPKGLTEARLSLNDIIFNSNWVFFDQWGLSEVFENSQILPYWSRYIQFWKLQVEFVVQNANIGKYLRWAEIIPKIAIFEKNFWVPSPPPSHSHWAQVQSMQAQHT